MSWHFKVDESVVFFVFGISNNRENQIIPGFTETEKVLTLITVDAGWSNVSVTDHVKHEV